jgi:NADP-dependent 3-hydroxy acid dehydrogenase YdfG
MLGALAGRRVLITGGSSGIGAAIAGALVEAGGRVALLARRVDRLADLAERLGTAATLVKCDITDEAGVPDAVNGAAEQLGGLDALINSAGLFTVGPVSDTDPAAWRAMFEVNVLGLLNITKAAVPHLRAGQAPAVINLSSMSGRRVPRADSGVYAATKFAVHALGEALRLELAADRIRVTTLAPGLVDTDITAEWPDNAYSREFRERLHADGLSPKAVADAVVHVLGTPPEVNVVEYAVMSITQ